MEKESPHAKYVSFDEFYRLEKEYDLFSFQYKGVPYWQLIRLSVHTQLSFSLYNVSGSQREQRTKQEIIGVFLHAFKMLKRWSRLSDVDIVRIRPTVQTDAQGNLCDRQFDFVNLGKDVNILDLFALGGYSTVPTAADITLAEAEARFILWKIKGRLFGKGRLDQQQISVLSRFFAELTKLYGVAFSVEEMASEMVYLAEDYRCYRRVYRKLFRKLSPRAVMLYPHYDQHMFSAVAAARELGIPSVEIQHGEIVDHSAYWYEDRTDTGKILPDYFLTYGQWWNDHIQLPEGMKAVAMGNPYLEDQVRKFPANVQQKTITFFSNAISGGDLIELIDSCYDDILRLGYKVKYKLHPGEVNGWQTVYPFLVEHPEIEVVASGSIYKLFSESTVVMGLRSTVFYEALMYDNLVIALDPRGHMNCLLDSGMVCPVTGKENLVRILEGQHTAVRSEQEKMTGIWMPQASEHTVEFIRELTSGSDSSLQ